MERCKIPLQQPARGQQLTMLECTDIATYDLIELLSDCVKRNLNKQRGTMKEIPRMLQKDCGNGKLKPFLLMPLAASMEKRVTQ